MIRAVDQNNANFDLVIKIFLLQVFPYFRTMLFTPDSYQGHEQKGS